MDTHLFDYPFPKELVAQHPLPRRDASRMMVLDRQTGRWEHHLFSEIPEYLQPGDLLVVNDAEADLVDVSGRQVPALPPYIKRKKPEDFTEEDYQRYRTVYAKSPGSKAAPTAGFHFTTEILEKLRQKGVEIATLTLHVSYDTYRPIRSGQIEDHPMHGEEFMIPVETQEAVIKAKQEGRRVVAVGTTVVRALETWDVGAGSTRLPQDGSTRPGIGRVNRAPTRTNLFITPGFKFQIVDALLTNFHRPRSTVLVMVSAFAGRELILKAYNEAIRERYRLFSYGDCMLVI